MRSGELGLSDSHGYLFERFLNSLYKSRPLKVEAISTIGNEIRGLLFFNAMKKLRCVDCRCFKYEDSDGLGFCDKWEESDISRDDDACVEFERKEDEYDERFGNTEGY